MWVKAGTRPQEPMQGTARIDNYISIYENKKELLYV